MDYEETSGNNLLINDSNYTIDSDDKSFNLKTIKIKKTPIKYSFIGGMWYSKDTFSFDQNISLPYPFSTYYTTKILDKKHNNLVFRSLFYVKSPLIVLQTQDGCICIKFNPIIQIDNSEIIPFISLSEDEEFYSISFHIFNDFNILEKESAWLGFGKKRNINLKLKKGDSFKFPIEIKKYNNWSDAIIENIEKNLPKKLIIKDAEKIFYNGKKALFRSYDNLTGSFLQLPWRNSPSFTFVNSSYSLMSYEAVRLYYFTKWYEKTKDIQFLEWIEKLRELFTNENLIKTDLKEGEGLVWYNMTNLTRKGLEGYFYMDCGYSGYPGGQATISFNLLKYLGYKEDKKLENLIRKSLKYILSTQNENGSWPMAIRQEGVLKFRPEKLNQFETYGGTAECVRALLLGYHKFNDENMKNSSLNALNFLESDYPICYNGLRDIGLNEAEAFSAVSIIEAFLDSYEILQDKKYLKNALTYAHYTLSWLYLYNTKNLKLKYNFHPISFSITPRLSPYESAWIVTTYLRLYEITKDKIWEKIAKAIYKEVTNWISKHGSLCEGIFPNYLEDLKFLPMDQTFATIELMNASSNFFPFQMHKKDKEITEPSKKLELKKDISNVTILHNDKIKLKFDTEKFKVTLINGSKLNEFGISFSLQDSHSIKNNLKRYIKRYMRGRYGKFILEILNLKYFLKGVSLPTKKWKNKPILIEQNKNKKSEFSINKNKIQGILKTNLHEIKYTISVSIKNNNLYFSFDPLIIKVLGHDLPVSKILFPIIGAKINKIDGDHLFFDGFHIECENTEIIKKDDFTAIDQTLSTNWTHGGIYKGKFSIVI